jgi:hypothetical protein
MQEQNKDPKEDSNIGFNCDCSSFSQSLKKVISNSPVLGFQVLLPSSFYSFHTLNVFYQLLWYRWTHLAVVCYLCCGVSSFAFVYNDWNSCVVSNQEFVVLFKRWYTGLFSVLGFFFFIFMYEIGWVCRETWISKKGAGLKCGQMMRLSV